MSHDLPKYLCHMILIHTPIVVNPLLTVCPKCKHAIYNHFSTCPKCTCSSLTLPACPKHALSTPNPISSPLCPKYTLNAPPLSHQVICICSNVPAAPHYLVHVPNPLLPPKHLHMSYQRYNHDASYLVLIIVGSPTANAAQPVLTRIKFSNKCQASILKGINGPCQCHQHGAQSQRYSGSKKCPNVCMFFTKA